MHGITELIIIENEDVILKGRPSKIRVNSVNVKTDDDLNSYVIFKNVGNPEITRQILLELLSPYKDMLDPVDSELVLHELADYWDISIREVLHGHT